MPSSGRALGNNVPHRILPASLVWQPDTVFSFGKAFLQTTWKWLLSSLILFLGFQNFVSGIASKYVNISGFSEVEAGMLANLRVPLEVNDFLVSVDRVDVLSRNEGLGTGDCRTVNLTVNGIFVREPKNFCSVEFQREISTGYRTWVCPLRSLRTGSRPGEVGSFPRRPI